MTHNLRQFGQFTHSVTTDRYDPAGVTRKTHVTLFGHAPICFFPFWTGSALLVHEHALLDAILLKHPRWRRYSPSNVKIRRAVIKQTVH